MRRIWFILLALMLLGIILSPAAAYTVTVKKAPTTDLRSGEEVSLLFEIKFASFSTKHDLVISSDLKDQSLNAQYYDTELQRYVDIQVVLDRTGNWYIYGWVLPSDTSFTLQMTMTGTVPTVTTTKNITLFMMRETSGGETVTGGEYRLEKRVVNPAEIATEIATARPLLQQLKSNISNVAATGVDVTEAQSKYTEAETALNRADSLKTTNFGEAQNQLDRARSAITEGEALLEKAVVLHEMEGVSTTMSNVSEMITYFKVNRSMSITDARLVAITSKYDLASQSLSSANDFIRTGAYSSARTKVQQAETFANEALNLSLALREEIGEGGLPINPLYIVAGAIIVVIAIAGYLAYRKFFRWDELG